MLLDLDFSGSCTEIFHVIGESTYNITIKNYLQLPLSTQFSPNFVSFPLSLWKQEYVSYIDLTMLPTESVNLALIF